MAERSKGQRIGSNGQRLVELLIEKSGKWISRRQDEDFGIDLEAEISAPSVRGEILKLQVKGKEAPETTPQGVKAVIETKYLLLATSLRVPLVFVLADVTGDRAWYLWLQGWIVDQRRKGRTTASFGETVTVYIPEDDTLAAGLQGQLLEIARWGHENQMVIALVDTLRTAVATRNEEVLLSLVNLIGSVDSAFRDFPIELLIDSLVELSAEPRGFWETSMLGRFLAIVGKTLGSKIDRQNILRMVIPGEGYSRAGLVGLGALYDEHEEHMRTMGLPSVFEEAGCPEVAYYCRLREKYPGVNSMDLAVGDFDYAIGGYSVEIEDKGWFVNKWANRGESAYLDYLVYRDTSPS